MGALLHRLVHRFEARDTDAEVVDRRFRIVIPSTRGMQILKCFENVSDLRGRLPRRESRVLVGWGDARCDAPKKRHRAGFLRWIAGTFLL